MMPPSVKTRLHIIAGLHDVDNAFSFLDSMSLLATDARFKTNVVVSPTAKEAKPYIASNSKNAVAGILFAAAINSALLLKLMPLGRGNSFPVRYSPEDINRKPVSRPVMIDRILGFILYFI